MNEIVPMMTELTQVIEKDIGNVMSQLDKHGPQIMDFLQTTTHLIEGVTDVITDVIDAVGWLLDHASALGSFLSMIPGAGLVQGLYTVVGAAGGGVNGGGASGDNHFQIQVNTSQADEKTAQQVGRETKKALEQARLKRQKEMIAHLHNEAIKRNIGGI